MYLMPNLLEGATVIEAPPPKLAYWKADNLVENLHARSARQETSYAPLISWGGVQNTDQGGSDRCAIIIMQRKNTASSQTPEALIVAA